MSIGTVERLGLVDDVCRANGGYAVVCDGCGEGLRFRIDDDPRYEIDTELFETAEAAARSAVNRGWSVEPPDGRDGAYCPGCIS